jgi:hypothetical protein
MTTITHSVSAVVLAAALALMAVPALAFAADYAYVDQLGNVRSTTADNWQAAIATAPNIHINSGVMLLTTANDEVVGDEVPAF